MTVVVIHLATTGFHHKSLLHLTLNDGVHEDDVRTLLQGRLGMTRADYDSLLSQLAEVASVVHDDKTYKKGMSAANPGWPSISFWPR